MKITNGPSGISEVVLCVALYFGLSENQGGHVFQPRNFKVSMKRPLQQLLLEWEVDSEAYSSGIEMVFNIQVNRTEENNIGWTENYTTALNTSNRLLKWSWFSEVALECVTHAVRIRSTVMSSEIWSNWSPWEIVDGLNVLDDSKNYILPEDKVIEEGSNIIFCCIAKKNEKVTKHFLYGIERNQTSLQRRVTFTAKNVQLSNEGGHNIECDFSDGRRSGTVLYVTRQPDQPNDLICETEDMIDLKCSWDPGQINTYYFSFCKASFTLSDVSGKTINCYQRICSFKIDKPIYTLTLKSKNCLGERHAHSSFEVVHRVHPVAPSDLSAKSLNATSIQITWHLSYIKGKLLLLCQIHGSYYGGEIQYNITVKNSNGLHHSTLDELQPYTNYTFRVRCGAAVMPFWKWSEWSKDATNQTHETAPSGRLDIWRDINPCLEKCNITVFWKVPPGLHAYGKIRKFEISWEKLEEPIVPHHVDLNPTWNNYTVPIESSSYKISVSARNSVNSSAPAVIVILAAEENGYVNCSYENTINNTANGIYISWKPQNRFDGYVVDWCNYPKSHPCDFQWKKFGENDSSALITPDAFSSGVRYTFRVYGSLGDETHLLEKKAKYLEESEPTCDPVLEISAVTSNSFTITWKFDHLNESHPGFIRGYNVYLKMEQGNCSLPEFEPLPDNPAVCAHTITDLKEKKFTVRHLKPNTIYQATVQAYSVNHKKISNYFSTVTTQSDGNWWLHLLLPLVIVPLMLIFCVCIWKSEFMTNCLRIPHPHVNVLKVAQWNVGTIKISDIPPSTLQVIEKHPVQSALGMFVENVTYFDPNIYQSLQSQQAASKKPNLPLTSYKPLQHLSFTSTAIRHLPEMSQDHLNYLSQTEVPLCVGQGGDFTSSVGPRQLLDYKPQLAEGSEANSPVSDEIMHLTATHW
ncbi:oncostatin-M-specific receptor subunit beta isoform X2 [Rhineura floridana]|uniref:oncostatin-M-specific receptor subunit beta isoform X2 n=1 Tax=Rhineura floridana TaxID=261503 RepID=UPI002AC85A53|nr:oncostatin-M-specific receptor subunit beta isoform X2 [Rhineura floridana]